MIKEVRAIMPDLGYSVSHTTRPQRFGEENGREYFFVDRAEFQSRVDDGEFLEFASVHGNLYGTSLAESQKVFQSGRDLIVEVDVQGAIQIMNRLPDESVTIFILPPSYDVLRARLTSRGTEGRAELDTRLRNAFDEVKHYARFDYVVINADLFTATRQISAIIMAERQCQDRQTEEVQVILDSFDAAKHQTDGE